MRQRGEDAHEEGDGRADQNVPGIGDARDVAEHRRLWTLEDEDGYPAPRGDKGRRVMPFWSSRSRAERIVRSVAAYAGFKVIEFTWDEFKTYWVSELRNAHHLVGVNWSGKFAVGYDVEPDDVVRNVEHQMRKKATLLKFRPRNEDC